MQRIKVNIGVKVTGYAQCEPIEVEAKCGRCIFFELGPGNELPKPNEEYGQCHRDPEVYEKNKDNWCGSFKPEVDTDAS